MRRFLTALKAVLKHGPFYLVAASGFITLASDEISDLLAPQAAETVATWAARVTAWLAVGAVLLRWRPSPAE